MSYRCIKPLPENTNYDILMTYIECLKPFNISNDKNKLYLLVSSIHYDEDICFNSNHREILYALCDYFKKVLTSDYCNFKESVFGKALNICVKKIPENPNFHEILYFYKANYFKRLSLLRSYFNKNNIDYYNLMMYKKFCISEYYPIKTIALPEEMIKNILSYVTPTMQNYYDVRNLYEKYRKIS